LVRNNGVLAVNHQCFMKLPGARITVAGLFLVPVVFGLAPTAWSQTRLASAQPAPALVAARAPAGDRIIVPNAEALVVMIRSSVIALSQANATNNYSVLNTLGSRSFQAKNPPIQLAQAFQAFRANRIDMSPVVYIVPQLSVQPVVANGTLRLVGIFPSRPMQVNFDLKFEPEEGAWKMADMAVNLTRSQ
jgi:hypothetical protein